MFKKSTCYPKLGTTRLCDGVTQGRRSTDNFLSFYVADMHSTFDEIETDDFMDPLNLAQLADDIAIYADNITSLKKKCHHLFKFSI